MSQGTSLQVAAKDEEWRAKVVDIEGAARKEVETLRKELEQAQLDKQLIGKSYE
jgi:hypothetical protein